MTETDFHSMKRKQLQALCKEHKIPANLTNLEMANRLTELFREKEIPFSGGQITDRVEDASETELNHVLVSKKIKKVRFSPENELIEFARSHKAKRSRRSMVLSRTSILPVENVNSSEELYSGNVGGPSRMQLRGKILTENVKNASRRRRKRVIFDEKIDNQASVNKTVEVPSRVTRSRGQKLEAAITLEENSRKNVVKRDGDVQALVSAGNIENREVNRRSLRSKGIANNGNLATGIGMKVNNDGKRNEVLDVNKIAKGKVMDEPQIMRRSTRRVNTVGSSKMMVEGLQLGAEVTRGKVETVLQNQETVEVQRSRRKTVLPSHEQSSNFEPEPKNEEVPKPRGVVRRSKRNKLDPKPVSSMPERKEQFVKPYAMDKEASFLQKNTRRSKRHASKSLEILDESGGDDVIEYKNETRKKKKVCMSKEVVAIDDSSLNTLSIRKESENEKVAPATIEVSDERKSSSILEESVFPEASLQEGIPELRESLSTQMSIPEVTGSIKLEKFGKNISATKLNPQIQENCVVDCARSPINSISLTDVDANEASGMKYLQREKEFSDMVVEKINLSLDTDAHVLVEESICVADNNDVAAQMISHISKEVTETSNVCENVADTFTLGDQEDFKTEMEVIEAEAEECIEPSSDLVDLVGEVKCSVQENLDPVEPVCINDVILPLECNPCDVDRLKKLNVSLEESNEDSAEKAAASIFGEGQVEADETCPHMVLNSELRETDENSLVDLFSCERSDNVVEEHETLVHKDVFSESAKSDDSGCLKDHMWTSEEDEVLTLDVKGNAVDQYTNKKSDEQGIFHGCITVSTNSPEVKPNAGEKDDVAETNGEKLVREISKNNMSEDNMSMDKTIMYEEHEATSRAEEISKNDASEQAEQPKVIPVEAIATADTIQVEESWYHESEIAGNSTTISSADNSKTKSTNQARNSTNNAISELEVGSLSEENFQDTMVTEIQCHDILDCNTQNNVNGELSEEKLGQTGQEYSTTPKGPNKELNKDEYEDSVSESLNKTTMLLEASGIGSEREENELQLLFAKPIKLETSCMVDEASGSGNVLESTSCKEKFCTVKENMVIETKSNDKIDGGRGMEYEKVINESLVFDHEVLNTGCIAGTDENNLQFLFTTPNKIEPSCEVDAICGSESKLEESCMEKVACDDESIRCEELNLAKGVEAENNSITVPPFANAFEASKKKGTMETYEQEKGTSSLSEENVFSLGKIFLDTEARYNSQKSEEKITTTVSPVKNLDEICHEKSLDTELSEDLKMSQSSELGSCLAKTETYEPGLPIEAIATPSVVQVEKSCYHGSEIAGNLITKIGIDNSKPEFTSQARNYYTGPENGLQIYVATLADNGICSREKDSAHVEIFMDNAIGELEAQRSSSEGKFQDIMETEIQFQDLLVCNTTTNVNGELSEEESGENRQENELQLLFAAPIKFEASCNVDEASSSENLLKSTFCKEDFCTGKANMVIETKSSDRTDGGRGIEHEKVINESLVFEATDHEVSNTGCIAGKDENLQLLFATPNKKMEASCEVNKICGSESKLEEYCVEETAPNDESIRTEELNSVKDVEKVENGHSRTLPPFANAFEASRENDTKKTYEQEKGTSSLSEENIFSLNQIFLDEGARDNDQELAEIFTTMASLMKTSDEICRKKLLDTELSENLKMGQSSELGSCLANGDTIQNCSNDPDPAYTQENNIEKETLIDAFIKPTTSSEMAKVESLHGETGVVTDKDTGTTFSDAEPDLFSNLEMHLFSGDNNNEEKTSNCNLESCNKNKDGNEIEESLLFQDKIEDLNDEILKESDVMETIQEYIDSESSKSIDIYEHFGATVPFKASVEESERSSNIDEPSEDSILDEVSVLRRVSTAKKTARTILIHGTPSKALVMADMKENEPFKNKPQIGDITTMRPAKRRALQDI